MRENKYRDVKMSRVLGLEGSWHFYIAVKIEYIWNKGALRRGSIPTKPRFRSVPDVAVLNLQLLTELLIKCRRLPRGFLWNTSLPSLVYGGG